MEPSLFLLVVSILDVIQATTGISQAFPLRALPLAGTIAKYQRTSFSSSAWLVRPLPIHLFALLS